MGTNYYSVKRGLDYTKSESFWDLRGTEDFIHIGKSSMGWCFSLHVVPELGINTLEDWIRMFIDPDRIIIDEYRETVSFLDMIRIITQRSRPQSNNWDADTMDRNHAEPGPNNLVRHRREYTERGRGCVRHGEGTWDCIEGEFS
jgi:hypothetical protein